MQRITVTVDDDVAELARREVAEGRAASLSAWVSEAMRRRALARMRLELEWDELRKTDPYRPEDIDWVAEALGADRDHIEKLLRTPIRTSQHDA